MISKIYYTLYGMSAKISFHRQMTSPADDLTDRDLADKKFSYNKL